MIVCAGDKETFAFATPVGVGLIQSAINLTRLCIMNPPKYILFVGTAGSYGEYNILDIAESQIASNIELSFLDDSSYTPINNVVSSQGANIGAHTLVNSSNYITTNKELAKNYLPMGIGLENMEFFSIMEVAKEFDVPCGGLFVVTNYTNESAHEDFKKNHSEAMKKIANYVELKIQRGDISVE